MSIINLICEYLVLPISDLLKGEKTFKYLRFIKETEQWSVEKTVAFRNMKLKQLIRYSAETVPYYRDFFASHSVRPDDICSVADLSVLPIVNKDIMRSIGIESFASEEFPIKNRTISKSSGSTGEPFVYYESKEVYSINMASKLRTWYLAGYRLGDKYMKIANSPRRSVIKKLQDWANRCIYVQFYSMTDEKLAHILDVIERERPKVIRSYPAPLFLLAQYRNQHHEYSYSPLRIMTTGSVLSESYREEIECAFGCDVIDSYSCEGTPNTYETPHHDGYHVSGVYGIIEVLDDEDKPVRDGIGRVVATDLWNYAHPFIRYNTKDLVEVKNGEIVRIMGRECESFVVANNARFTVHNFTCFFSHDVKGVDAYQIVKKKDGFILFKLVVNPQYSDQEERLIIDFWSGQFGLDVAVDYVDEIPLMNNNKHLSIVEE